MGYSTFALQLHMAAYLYYVHAIFLLCPLPIWLSLAETIINLHWNLVGKNYIAFETLKNLY